MEKKYRYFIAFASLKGFGNAESCLKNPIESINDVNMVARSLEKDFNYPGNTIVILNYKLLDLIE